MDDQLLHRLDVRTCASIAAVLQHPFTSRDLLLGDLDLTESKWREIHGAWVRRVGEDGEVLSAYRAAYGEAKKALVDGVDPHTLVKSIFVEAPPRKSQPARPFADAVELEVVDHATRGEGQPIASQPIAPQPNPIDETSLLDPDLDFRHMLRDGGMPFEKTDGVVPLPQTEDDPAPHPTVGETVLATQPAVRGLSLPFGQKEPATSGIMIGRLTLKQFAALEVEIGSSDTRVSEVLATYQVDTASLRMMREELLRVSADPAVKSAFGREREAYAHWRQQRESP